MLARKHYAQKGVSSGAMNTRAVARSASSVIKGYASRPLPTYKPIADKTSGTHTKELEYDAIKCTPGPQTSSVIVCPPPSTGCKVVPAIHKDTTARTAGQQIQHVIITRSCFENDPVPTNNTC